MKRILVLFFIILSMSIYAQGRKIAIDTTVVTNHSAIINGQNFSYTANIGMQPVWDAAGDAIATLNYTYYTRDNVNRAERPIVFSFNGGPGSASVWMHVAYTGPKVLNMNDEGYPIQPYGVSDNPHSILDVADIVFVNPVNTGYSRMVENKDGELPDRKLFFGINADIKYLAEWMNTFISRNNRWESPKYIVGESYGGTRVMGLAHELQNNQWMYLNGVIMVSPADYLVYANGEAVGDGLNLPYFTAAAWYHKQLSPELQNQDLLDILPAAEDFAINAYIPAIAKGGFISDAEKDAIAEQVAYYSGLSKKAVLQENLRPSTSFFWKELLREESGHTIGRLDSRYLGIDSNETGDSPEYSPELTTWLHAFTPAINYYLREELNFKTDVKYNMFGDVHPWNRENNNVRDNLRKAMTANPYLNVLVQNGYYDGATTYFQGKYTMWQIDPSGKLKDRMTFKAYRSGHMMYLRKEDLQQANEDLREFIESTQFKGIPAKH